MKSFVHFTIVAAICGLISTIALGHNNSDTWGYMRVDNDGAYVIATRCYDIYGNDVNSWQRTPIGGFRSCHGAYIRVDFLFLDAHKTQRFWRSDYDCGNKGLYVTLKGTIDFFTKVEVRCE